METHIWTYVLAIVLLIICSAYFSATETAFTSVSRIRIKNEAGDGDRKAGKVLYLIEKYDDLLSSILIGNNLVNIATTSLATVMFIKLYGDMGATISTIVVTVVVLIFGEITPKSLAKEDPEGFSKFSGPIIHGIMLVLTPFNFVLRQWKNMITRLFKVGGSSGFTEDELITIVEEAETEGNLDEERSELIQNAIEFNDLDAVDIITPRVDVVAIEKNARKEEVARLFRETGFTRVPVYDNDIDNVIGILNQKDFHNYVAGTNAPISDYISPTIFVPETMDLPVLLKKLRQAKTHIAVVIDEYGGTSGIITMEDIIEEIVGEIYDEHDTVTSQEVLPMYDGSYRVKAGCDVEDFFEFFDIDVDMEDTTVNGWIMRTLDKLPERGDSFTYVCEGREFTGTVTKADSRKALEVNFTVRDLPEEES